MNEPISSNTAFRLQEQPPPPGMLSPAAREYWLELVPIIFELKTARVCDLPALVLLCEARADVDALQQTLREEGFATESAAGTKKSHPAIRSLENARRQVEIQMDRFGLLPGTYIRKAPDYAQYLLDVERRKQREAEREAECENDGYEYD